MKVKVLLVLLSSGTQSYLKINGEIPSLYAFRGDDPYTLSQKIYDEYVNYSYSWVDICLSGCYIDNETVYIVFRSFIDRSDINEQNAEWQKIKEIKDEFISKLVQKSAMY